MGSGLLLILSFPKFGSGILAWVSLIPLFFALTDVTPRKGFKIGFLAGLVAYIGILYWIAVVVVQYGYLPIYVGISVLLLLAAYLSLYTAIFSAGIVFLRGKGIPLCLSAPIIWTILEYFRSHLLSGFPWENLAYSQYLHPNIIQIADVTGLYGVSFVLVLTNAVLFDLLQRRLSRRSLYAEVLALAVILMTIYGYGHIRYKNIGSLLESASEMKVSLIQGNIDQNIKWDAQYQTQTIDIYRSLSLEAVLPEGGLIVWPETAAPFYFQRQDMMHASVVDIAKKTKSALLFGSPSYVQEGGNTYYKNSAFLLGEDGKVKGQYDKVHLVPYGEYVPFRRYFPFIGKLVTGVGDFRQGQGFYPLEMDGHRLGVLICYEGIFPEAARDYKLKGADFLVNITNDAWFGKTSAPYQHLSMTVFRAVENRLSLVRAANTGISAIIDPRGNIITQTGLFERTALKGTIKIVGVKSYYAAYGDVFVYGCIAILIVLSLSKKKRRTKHAGRNS